MRRSRTGARPTSSTSRPTPAPDAYGPPRRVTSGGRNHREDPGTLRHEASLAGDHGHRAGGQDIRRGLAGHREFHRHAAHREAARIPRHGREDDHVARAHRLLGRLQRQGGNRVRLHLDGDRIGGPPGRGGQRGGSRLVQQQRTVRIDFGDRGVGAGELDVDVVPQRPARIHHFHAEPRMGAGVEPRRNTGEADAIDGRLRHGHRHFDPRHPGGPPAGIVGIGRYQRHERELARPVCLDGAAARHRDAPARPRVEHHDGVFHDGAVGVAHGRREPDRTAHVERQRGRLNLDDQLSGRWRGVRLLGRRRHAPEHEHEPDESNPRHCRLSGSQCSRTGGPPALATAHGGCRICVGRRRCEQPELQLRGAGAKVLTTVSY